MSGEVLENRVIALYPWVVGLDVQGVTHGLIVEVVGDWLTSEKFIPLLDEERVSWGLIICGSVLQPWSVLILVDTSLVGDFLSVEDGSTIVCVSLLVIRLIDLVILPDEVIRIQLVEYIVNFCPVFTANLWFLPWECEGIANALVVHHSVVPLGRDEVELVHIFDH